MTLLTAVLTETEAAHEAGLPTWIFGAITLGVFAVLGLVTFSFRDVANRHAGKAAKYAAAHSGGQEHGGH